VIGRLKRLVRFYLVFTNANVDALNLHNVKVIRQDCAFGSQPFDEDERLN